MTAPQHLRTLLSNEGRNAHLRLENGGGDFILDFTHAKIDAEGFSKLLAVAEETKIFEKIEGMFSGQKINNTEKRSVLHVALRMMEGESLVVPESSEGDAVKNVHSILHRMRAFSEEVRTGAVKGYSGKQLHNTLVIGIGGSYLGPEFVFEALRTDAESMKGAAGRKLKFLANVDPIDF